MPDHPNMICPLDGSPLQMSERSGIEIDYCPKCRGVWLDRGELDKIIERSAAVEAAAQPPAAPYSPGTPGYAPQAPTPPQPYGAAPRGPWDGGHGHKHGYPHKRRKSFLEDLFD